MRRVTPARDGRASRENRHRRGCRFPRRYAAAEYLRRASRRHEVQNGPQTDPNICAVRPELVEACPERLTSQSKGAALSFSGVHIRTVLRQAQHERKQRSEEHTSELQSLMRISYAVFCLKKKIKNYNN